MVIIKNISIVFIFSLLVFLAMIALIRNEWLIHKPLYLLIMSVLFGAFVVYAFSFDVRPIARWDLLEHYKTIDLIKKNGWDFAWTKGEYRERYVITLYFYLMSFMPNYRLLPVIPLIADFSIAIYLFRKTMEPHEIDGAYLISDVAFTTLAWLATFGIKLALFGIRCVCAVAFCTLGIYWEAIEKKHKMAAYAMYVIAYGIHDFALIIILIRLLMTIRDKRLLATGVLFGMVGLTFAIPVLYSAMPTPAIRRIYKYWTRSSILSFIEGQSTSTLLVILCMILTMLYYAYMNIKIRRMLYDTQAGCEEIRRNPSVLPMIEFTSSLAVVAVAACYLYVFTERLLYLVAYGFLMCIPYYRKFRANNFYVDSVMLFILLWLWFFNDIYLIMVNETGVYFLAQ